MGFLKLLASIGATAWAYGSDKAERNKIKNKIEYKERLTAELIDRYCDLELELMLSGCYGGEYGKDPSTLMRTSPYPWSDMHRPPNTFIAPELYSMLIAYREEFREYIFHGFMYNEYLSWNDINSLRVYFCDKRGLDSRFFESSDWFDKQRRRALLCMCMMLCGKLPISIVRCMVDYCIDVLNNPRYAEDPKYDWVRYILNNPNIPVLIDKEVFRAKLKESCFLNEFSHAIYTGNPSLTRDKYLLLFNEARAIMEAYGVKSADDIRKLIETHHFLGDKYDMSKLIYSFEDGLILTSHQSHPKLSATVAFLRVLGLHDSFGIYKDFARLRPCVNDVLVSIHKFDYERLYKNPLLIDIAERRMKSLGIDGGIEALLDVVRYNGQQIIDAFANITKNAPQPPHHPTEYQISNRLRRGSLPIYPDGAPLTVEEYEASR